MKKTYLLIAVALLLFGVVSSAGVLDIPSAEAQMALIVAGGGTPAEPGGSCASGTGGLDSSGETDTNYQNLATDGYQMIDNNEGTISICQVDLYKFYSSTGTSSFTITIQDNTGTPVANGAATETCEVDGSYADNVCTFTFSTNPEVTGDFRISFTEVVDGVRVRTTTDEWPSASYEGCFDPTCYSDCCLFKISYIQ